MLFSTGCLRLLKQNATLDKAGALGIKSARLPISKYIKLKTSHVLTVNQMVEIFVSYLEARHDGKSVDECWTHAFKCVIPQRKVCHHHRSE